MRRFLIAIVALTAVVALLAPAGALAAKPKVVGGAAHRSGDQVKGWFVLKATGSGRTPRKRVAISLGDGRTSRLVGRHKVPSLKAGRHHKFEFTGKLPASLPSGGWRIRACLPGQCLRLGQFTLTAGGAGGGNGGSANSKPEGTKTEAHPRSPTYPSAPIPYTANVPFFRSGAGFEYWARVPRSYDATNETPTTLFVWFHGCEGKAEEDIPTVDPTGAAGEEEGDWLMLSLAGRETLDDECWEPTFDTAKAVAAIADFKTHFNVNPRRVILGGYSSGGNLAYHVAFENANLIAGLLIENSAPFEGTGLSAQKAIGDAAWKFPVVQLAHLEDQNYKIAQVREELAQMEAAGFPIDLIERPGPHSDANTAPERTRILLPFIDGAGWLGPGS
jgi:predicted esterase